MAAKRKPVPPKVLSAVRREVIVDLHDEDDPPDPEFLTLNNKMRARYDRFVAEFVFDYNASQAMMRMGYAQAGASVRAHTWLKHPYVQWKLKDYVNKLEAQTLCTRGNVIAMLVREANYYGPDGNAASRVAACRQLAKALGLNVLKIEQEVRNVSVMEVPMVPSTEDWSSAARESQRQLREHSHE